MMGETTVQVTNWSDGAKVIANEIYQQGPTYGTVYTVHGKDHDTQLRILHEATIGDLAICFFLALLTGTILLRWMFQSIWGR
jgi:hypothetical protein